MSTSSVNPWLKPRRSAPTSSLATGLPVLTDIASMPVRKIRATAAELIFRTGVRNMPIRVELPDGQCWGAGGPGDPVMLLARPAALFRRLGRDANIGFGEAYQAGDWSSPQLADLLTAFATQLTTVIPPALQGLRVWAQRVHDHLESNTATTARRNTAAHYDLSNEMFATFLDETMTYSCAWFDSVEAGEEDGLTRAQLRKIDGVLDNARIRQGSEVIEIGTGWGALSIRAAQRGATVTSLTLSVEQQRLAQQRVREAGVADRVTILLQDYREAVGQYDAVVSVEMIEAVGADYWPTYFATLDALVKPGGRVALQSITMRHDRMQVSRRAYTWINKHIFPGGLVPSIEAIEATIAEHTDLRITERRDLGPDYARTLRCWRERFLAKSQEVAALGFDQTFMRTWEYYLAYSEAGFRAQYIDVSLFELSKMTPSGSNVPDVPRRFESADDSGAGSRRALVTGATGYIGGRLVPNLLDAGFTVRVLARHPERLRDWPSAGRVEVSRGDASSPAEMTEAMRDVDVAYYLLHSLTGGRSFAAVDRKMAQTSHDLN